MFLFVCKDETAGGRQAERTSSSAHSQSQEVYLPIAAGEAAAQTDVIRPQTAYKHTRNIQPHLLRCQVDTPGWAHQLHSAITSTNTGAAGLLQLVDKPQALNFLTASAHKALDTVKGVERVGGRLLLGCCANERPLLVCCAVAAAAVGDNRGDGEGATAVTNDCGALLSLSQHSHN